MQETDLVAPSPSRLPMTAISPLEVHVLQRDVCVRGLHVENQTTENILGENKSGHWGAEFNAVQVVSEGYIVAGTIDSD
jgi:hypothetical protein